MTMVDELRKMHGDFKNGLSMVEKALQSFEAVKAGKPGMPGTPGRSGADGRDVSQEQVDAAVKKMLIQPRQPEDGVAPTVEDIATTLLKQPKLYKIIKKMLKSGDKTNIAQSDTEEKDEGDAMKAFVEEKIAGVMKMLEGKVAEVRNYAAMNAGMPAGGLAGKIYGKDTSLRGGGDIVLAGNGVTIVNSGGKKIINATPAALGIIAVSGTIDDTNVTFTAATQPTLLNINGSFYQKTGGTFTWTYVAGTITLNNAVGTGGSIFGI